MCLPFDYVLLARNKYLLFFSYSLQGLFGIMAVNLVGKYALINIEEMWRGSETSEQVVCEAKGIFEENDGEMSRNRSFFILVQLEGFE